MSNELVPYSDIEKMGTAVATSGLFGVKTPQQAIALMLVAQAYGQHPAVAAMEYHIIAGKPSKKSEAMLASFIQAGGKVQWHKLDETIADATFSHPSGGELRMSWDIKMAEKAGLLAKDGSLYKKYPRAMLRSRLIAEGVRTIYPAATGGMLAREEIEDIVEDRVDPTKSRIENIIDAQSEVVTDAKKPAAEEKPKVEKKSTKNKDKDVVSKPMDEKEGIKTVTGIIEETPKVATVEKDGKPAVKHSFKLGELRYGTFDTVMAKKILECVDQRILVKFEYTERVSNGKTFQDIVSFSEVSADDIPI